MSTALSAPLHRKGPKPSPASIFAGAPLSSLFETGGPQTLKIPPELSCLLSPTKPAPATGLET